MLSRLIGCTVRRTLALPSRTLRMTAVARSGGHHDHHEPTPVHIPQPGPWERNFFGEGKAPRVSENTPYVPSASCYTSYIGAAVGVLLTFLAIATYTDAFKKDAGHHHSSKTKLHKEHPKSAPVEETETVEAVKEQHEEKAEPVEEPAVVVEKVEEQTNTGETPKSESADVPVTEEVKPDEEVHVEIVPVTPTESADETTPKTEKVPEYVEYLLVGAGTASYYAALAIRARDAEAKVLMIGDEPHLPYNRPPLSKELWWYESARDSLTYKALSGKKRDVYFEASGFFVPAGELNDTAHGGVSLAKGRRVTRICTNEKKAFLDDGTEIRFGKCLIATGGRPKPLPELVSASDETNHKILYFRGVDDYQKVDRICSEAKSVTIVGGGFLGSELAYGIKRKYENLQVNQIIPEGGNLAAVLPEYLSKKATDSLRKFGVNVLTETKVVGAKTTDINLELKLTGSDEKLTTDYVLVAVGIEPDTSVAEASGLEIDQKLGGIVADAELRVCPGVYAAGDVCSFVDRSLGRRRLEHWEHAQISGRLAGENMTGGEKAFWYQPSFFTKLSPEYHINAVGNTDASLRTVSVFAKDDNGKGYERGVVFYQNEESKVVGVLMVNVFGPSLDVSRRLIEDGRPVKDFRELAKLFPLYEMSKEEKESSEEHSSSH